MTPDLARLAFCVGIAGLFWLDRDRDRPTSPAIWLAIAWLAIGSSRNLSQWLGAPPPIDGLEQYEQGNALDRLGLGVLEAASLGVLMVRHSRVTALLRSNLPIVCFLLFCLASVAWSDFPVVTLKRWIKTLGNVTMILIVLTEIDPVAALRRLLAWTGFFLIPLSVLFVKYFPDLGRAYNRWTWTPSFVGVATDKNGLGVICFVFGLAAFWRLVEAIREDASPGRTRRIVAHGSIVAMALWLFTLADSSTSLGCFLLGSAVITGMTVFRLRRPVVVHRLTMAMVVVAVLAYVVLDADTLAIEAFGRDTTLTGRTELWEELMHTPINAWIGTGFESFWLGDRARYFWDMYWWHPNQAHNGYLEMYLDLGLIGVGLLALLIVAGYRNIVASFAWDPALARLRMAFILVIPLYNITEAAFKLMNPVWVAFLLIIIALPEQRRAAQTESTAGEVAPSPLVLGPRLNPAYNRLRPYPQGGAAATAGHPR